MNKTIRLFFALVLVVAVTTSCKSKQKIAEIPAGANIQATAVKTVEPVKTVTPSEVTTNIASEPEVTRNENFSLAEGETNADALKMKYHVVVGSFSKQSNAKGLQAKLNGEGNKAVIVVNESGMFRVLIASFNDYKEAHVRIKQISSHYPDAWVLVKK